MKSIDLNTSWNLFTNDDEIKCDLPYDVLVDSARDFSCSLGELNGYHPTRRAVFVKTMPRVAHGKAVLVVSGACGFGDVFLNGEVIGSLRGYAPQSFDLTDRLLGSRNILKLDMISSPGMSDKYTGLGIAGGVKLVVSDVLDIDYQSLFVKTDTVGDKTYADVEVSVTNGGEAVKFVLDCTATNARGKRAGKKQRKIYMRAGQTKTFTVRVRINKAYEWTPSDPYMYSMTAKIITADGAEKQVATRFGIVSRSLNNVRGLYINNKNTLLLGAYISHADAALGGVSNYSNEKRRLEALRSAGYNAVHYVECPTDAALDACDDTGMYAFVDIYSQMYEGKAPLDGHIFFDGGASAGASVLALRNHPSVTLYGVADDVPECYNRHDGHAAIARVASIVREFDGTRPVTVSAREFVPTAKELDEAGVSKLPNSDAEAVNVGRERGLFDALTAGAFEAVDVCGFNYLHPLYSTEKLKRDRLIIGARTSSDRAFESLDETEKNSRVIGDFNECGIDYPGGGKINEILCTRGDFDAICDEKPQSVYKRILLGARNIAYITVLDPDTDEPVHMWNWPRSLGQTVTVRVYTSGDVVALYLNGRLVGRKLAGRINKHTATFKTEYYPGTLEAVGYYKGVECARTRLKSAGSPKSVRLSAYDKSLSLSRGDVGFVYIDVCDRDGDIVPYAMRSLTATVTGARLLSFINADPMLRKNSFDTCPAYGGRAMAVIKPEEEGKAVVKITGDGLLSSKISFKIKE